MADSFLPWKAPPTARSGQLGTIAEQPEGVDDPWAFAWDSANAEVCQGVEKTAARIPLLGEDVVKVAAHNVPRSVASHLRLEINSPPSEATWCFIHRMFSHVVPRGHDRNLVGAWVARETAHLLLRHRVN